MLVLVEGMAERLLLEPLYLLPLLLYEAYGSLEHSVLVGYLSCVRKCPQLCPASSQKKKINSLRIRYQRGWREGGEVGVERARGRGTIVKRAHAVTTLALDLLVILSSSQPP